MAGGAGRRNILRELTSLGEGGITIPNTLLPLTPTSPDESLIQLRGYHRKSATYNYDATDPVFFKTPTKSPKKSTVLHSTPTKITVIRSSPRKKLNLTPSKLKQNEAKMLKLHNMNHVVNIEKNIKALSHAQLVQLINDVAKVSPCIKETLSSLVPVPDLKPIEERLHALQRNVLKSFPRNIWGNQDGSFCFLRVRAHLEAFKKECLEYCRQFMESQHWPSIFRFILIAWKIALDLPNWSTVAHNKIKSSCIRYLATQCLNAFKKSKIDEASLNEIIQRMEELGNDFEIKTCVTYARDLIKYDP